MLWSRHVKPSPAKGEKSEISDFTFRWAKSKIFLHSSISLNLQTTNLPPHVFFFLFEHSPEDSAFSKDTRMNSFKESLIRRLVKTKRKCEGKDPVEGVERW